MELEPSSSYNKLYHKYLVDFMRYKDTFPYDNNEMFRPDQLITILPEEIVRWMRVKRPDLNSSFK